MERKQQVLPSSGVSIHFTHDEVHRLAERTASRLRDRFGIPSVSLVPRDSEPEVGNWVPFADNERATRMLLASRIDHTLLRSDVTNADLWRLCDEARTYRFATVCVNGVHVRACRELLAGTAVGICSVVGFPLGASTAATKAFEAREAVDGGASEIDMVMNIGALKEADHEAVRADIHEVVRAAQPARVKVILETALLSDEEKIAGCMLARLSGARFVKTSSGYGPAGATPRDVALLRWAVDRSLGVKASGGIGTREAALQMLQAGADRIGASAGVAIVSGSSQRPAR